MTRLPLTLRALLLVPLLAVGVDFARATLACGTHAESCLEAAGQGWLGGAGSVLLVVYAAGLALVIAGVLRGRPVADGDAPGFARSWLIGTAGVAAVCGGQALLAGLLGDGASLGGGWAELLAFCAVAGALLALALRVAPAATALVHSLRAPRPSPVDAAAERIFAALSHRPAVRFAFVARGRGPPSPLD